MCEHPFITASGCSFKDREGDMKQLRQLNFVELGERVRKCRELAGMTREQLAEKIDVSTKFMADVECGAKGLSLKRFYALVQILDIPSDYLLSGDADNHHRLLCSIEFYIE